MGEEELIRSLPTNDLDLNLMLTNSVWGSKEVPQELRDKLLRFNKTTDENGQVQMDKASLWGLLGFFTRDMRLGNLSSFDNELQTCRYHFDLANDYLSVDMGEPFIIALERGVNIVETSQSKGGFLRRITNTLRHENISQNSEPPKKQFFGGSKEKRGGY